MEIHFQVKGRKLFCEDEGDEIQEYNGSFLRKLRVVSGEKSGKDIAAVQESLKGKEHEYLVTNNSCLVEMDEEPPHTPGKETVDTAVIVSLILKCKVVDNLHFMRKIVIDGSNTSGFQRTGIVGLAGEFDFNHKKIGISTVTLEEEACKKVREDRQKITYSLDRLGIPLIEIATEPDIKSPKEARLVAEAIGMSVRQSKMIRREVSSIRQDLNISIGGGNRVEIKGIQSLKQIEKVLTDEVSRQRALTEISQMLKEREAKFGDIVMMDLSDFKGFKNSELISKGLKQGKRVYAFRLPFLSGLLKHDELRLGREISDRLRVLNLGGIIHSDELPSYGIDKSQKDAISELLKCKELDAFGISIMNAGTLNAASEVIRERIDEALVGVPPETRSATETGSKFLRPLPGGSRMYPETDVPLIALKEVHVKELQSSLPKTVKERTDQLHSMGIPEQEALNSIRKEYDEILEEFVGKYGNPKTSAVLLAVIYSSEKRDLQKGREIMKKLKDGEITKEGAIDMYQKKGMEALHEDAEATGQDKKMDWRDLVISIVDKNLESLEGKGTEPFKPLMGEVMKELRGKVDGKIVSDFLKKQIAEASRKSRK